MNSKKYSIWFLTVSLVIIVLLAGAYQLSYSVCRIKKQYMNIQVLK